MSRFVPCLFIFCFVTTAVHLWSRETVALELQFTPSLTVREEYVDNVSFTTQNEDGAFISTISPGLEFRHKTELLNAYISAHVDGVNYFGDKFDERDVVDHFYSLGLTHQLSKRWKNRIDLKYTEDSRSDRDEEDTGLLLTASPRQRQQYSYSGDYVVSEKTNASVSYRYNRDDYEDIGFIGYKAHSISLGLSSDLSSVVENFRGQASLSLHRYNYPGFKVGNYSMTLGGTWRYSEKFAFQLTVGPRYARSEFDTPETLFGIPTGHLLKEINDGWGVNGAFSLNYQGLYYNWTLSLSQEIDQASGRNGATERKKAIFEVGRRLTERSDLKMQFSYYWNTSDAGEFSASKIDTETLRINPQYNNRITENLTVGISYSYIKTEEQSVNAKAIEKNAIFINLRYSVPLFD